MLALVHICYRNCSVAYSLSALELTPSILFVFVRLFYFLLSPRSYSCSGKKCALPLSEPLVDHRPVKKKWLEEDLTYVCVGGVTLQWLRWLRVSLDVWGIVFFFCIFDERHVAVVGIELWMSPWVSCLVFGESWRYLQACRERDYAQIDIANFGVT